MANDDRDKGFPLLQNIILQAVFKENNYTLNLALLKNHTRTAIMLFICVLKFSWSLSCEDELKNCGPGINADSIFKRMRKCTEVKKCANMLVIINL